MQITDIKVRKLMQEGRLRAVVSVTIGDELAIHDIKVIEGPTRLFVAMPSRREAGGVFRDIAHPITPAGRRQVGGAVLSVFRRGKAGGGQVERGPYGDYFAEHFAASPASAPAAAVTPPLGNTGG